MAAVAEATPSATSLYTLYKMANTVDELFSFTLADQSARRVAFGSQVERKMFPYHAPPTKMGIECKLRGSPKLAPGCYDHDPAGTFVKPLNDKPCSKKGCGFGATLVPRSVALSNAGLLKTPSPVKYQKLDFNETADSYKPFGLSQPRFKTSIQELKPTPGAGQYEHDVKCNRKISYDESFGGRRAIIPTITRKCHQGEPDLCKLCSKAPVGDYFAYRKTVLCRNCYNYQLQMGEKFPPSFLMAFDKVRDCTAVHSHEGTKATILLRSEKQERRLKQKESYFKNYFT